MAFCAKTFADKSTWCMRIGYICSNLKTSHFLPLFAVLEADRIPPRLILIILKGNKGPDPLHMMCTSLGLYGGRGRASQILIRKIRGTIFCVVRTSADRVPSHRASCEQAGKRTGARALALALMKHNNAFECVEKCSL